MQGTVCFPPGQDLFDRDTYPFCDLSRVPVSFRALPDDFEAARHG